MEKTFSRAIQAYERGIITNDELVSTLFDGFAGESESLATFDAAAEIWKSVPGKVRDEFVREVQIATSPAFRRQAFHCSGTRTEDQLRKDEDEQTARVQKWAAFFQQVFGA
jgi:hypothetical protein